MGLLLFLDLRDPLKPTVLAVFSQARDFFYVLARRSQYKSESAVGIDLSLIPCVDLSVNRSVGPESVLWQNG